MSNKRKIGELTADDRTKAFAQTMDYHHDLSSTLKNKRGKIEAQFKMGVEAVSAQWKADNKMHFKPKKFATDPNIVPIASEIKVAPHLTTMILDFSDVKEALQTSEDALCAQNERVARLETEKVSIKRKFRTQQIQIDENRKQIDYLMFLNTVQPAIHEGCFKIRDRFIRKAVKIGEIEQGNLESIWPREILLSLYGAKIFKNARKMEKKRAKQITVKKKSELKSFIQDQLKCEPISLFELYGKIGDRISNRNAEVHEIAFQNFRNYLQGKPDEMFKNLLERNKENAIAKLGEELKYIKNIVIHDDSDEDDSDDEDE